MRLEARFQHPVHEEVELIAVVEAERRLVEVEQQVFGILHDTVNKRGRRCG